MTIVHKSLRLSNRVLSFCLTLSFCFSLTTAATAQERGRYVASNGKTFSYEKTMLDGREETLYTDGRDTFNESEMSAWEAKNPPPRVAPELLERALREGGDLELIVLLRGGAGAGLAKEVFARHQDEIDRLSAEVQDMHRALRPNGDLTPEQERALRQRHGGELPALTDGDREAVRQRAAAAEARLGEARREIRERAAVAVRPVQARFRKTVRELGGKVLAQMALPNAVGIRLPADQLVFLADNPDVLRVEDSYELTPALNNQGHTASLEPQGFWGAGIDGDIWDVGVIDTCVQQNHPSLDHLNYQTNTYCSAVDYNGHGTAVAGVIASDHPTYRGAAYGLDKMLVGAADTNLLVRIAADWMVGGATDDAEAINLSYNFYNSYEVDYTGLEQYLDGLIDNYRVTVSTAAGNIGNGYYPANEYITHPGAAYNTITVSNMDDGNTADRSDDVIAWESSRGPTFSGRKKPDLAAPGENTYTTNNDWATAADFINASGTSIAAGHVTAASVLLTDLRNNDDPLARKAVLINTADAWTDNGTTGTTADDGPVAGSEWNRTYGWGYLDLWEAWYNGTDVFVSTVDDGVSPSGPDYKLYKGYLYMNEKATLVWNRQGAYNGINPPTTMERLSDLDLHLHRASDGTTLASSMSRIDNVEQVATTENGSVILRVDVWGTLDSDISTEAFALATEENFVAVNPPDFAVTSATSNVTRNVNPFNFSATFSNDSGSAKAFNVTVKIKSLPYLMQLVGPDTQTLGDMEAGATASANWQTYWPCLTGQTGKVSYEVRTTSYGETTVETMSSSVVCTSSF